MIRKKPAKNLDKLIFIVYLILYLAIFLLTEYIIYYVCYQVLNLDEINKLMQFVIWCIGFGMGLFLLFIPYVRKNIFWMLSFALVIVYLVTFFKIEETDDNAYIDFMQNFVFLVEFLLLPFSVKQVLEKKNGVKNEI